MAGADEAEDTEKALIRSGAAQIVFWTSADAAIRPPDPVVRAASAAMNKAGIRTMGAR